MLNFSLTQLDLDELNARIDTFAEAVGKPRSAVVRMAQFTAKLNEFIKELDELLKPRLDTFVKSLVVSSPNFMSLFLRAM